MNILVIGNGFDLAHGLPTKYTDFLDFLKIIIEIKNSNIVGNLVEINKKLCEKSGIDRVIRFQIPRKFGMETLEEGTEDLLNCILDNVWIEYFLQCPMYQKENWIDFESEISNVIKSIDNDINNGLTECKLEDKIRCISNEFLNNRYIEWFSKKSYKELRDVLLNDLNRLIRALEIYLTEYVESKEREVKELVYIKELEINHVISFNYSHTHEKEYNVGKNIEYDYIHGEVNINNTIESNNMVLGIDEYLSKKRKNKDIEFIAFKKFYQRIYKGTGCKYKEWVDKIRDEWENETEENKKEIRKCISKGDFNNEKIHRVYIFGHSLDVTDRDILRDLILNDNVHTTIFYPDKEELGRKIANLNIVIEQDELIKRTGGSTKTIEFKQQQEMIPINKSKDI